MVPRITVQVRGKTGVGRPPWGLVFGTRLQGRGGNGGTKERIVPPCTPPLVRAEEGQKAGERRDLKRSGASERGVKLSVAVLQRGDCCRLCLIIAATGSRSAV